MQRKQTIVLCSVVVTVALLTPVAVAAPTIFEPPLCNCDRVRPLYLRSPPITGTDVTELQTALAQLEFYKGPVDGIYLLPVVQAVKKMQTAFGLPATGNMDDSTWEALAVHGTRPVTSTKPPTGIISVLVDIDAQTLVVYSDGIPFKLYPVAIGKPESPTPIGEWVITEKIAGWHGATGVRWMRLSNPWGSYGIHGTNNPGSIGYRASAGCIRMFNHDVSELYDWVSIGTLVVLKGSRRAALHQSQFAMGAVGQDVVYLQWRLRELGFDLGRADGVFGADTAQAVANWQTYRGLAATGKVDNDLLYLLGLR
ncbi:MAG: peptidoglycan-binding protein [bacterium]|jgi:L,D-transpeptidase ErfK/SrfK